MYIFVGYKIYFMKIERHWVVAFALIAVCSVVGLFWHTLSCAPNTGEFLSEDKIVGADVAWILASSGLVLLMTPGLSFFYGGMVGKKNMISTMLQSFISLGVISIVWMIVGFSLSFGDSIGITINGEKCGIIGNPLTYTFFT